ncbi:hypothetical protein RI054_05g29810 [Pseudoscourfieldia marina]
MEKLKEDGTLRIPHTSFTQAARTKVSKSACVFNIGTKIGPGGRRIAKTSVPHAPSTNLRNWAANQIHIPKTTHSALDYAFATDVSETPGFEPRTYEEAIHSKDHERWILAIDRIKYNTNSNVPLKLIGSATQAGDNHENRRSTSGYIFFLNGGPISWASYLQTTVALSTVESEVMALTEAIKEAIYIPEALVDHPTSHRRTKHIEIRREFIKFHIGHETVKIERVSTKDQLADIDEASRQDIHNYLVQMILHG